VYELLKLILSVLPQLAKLAGARASVQEGRAGKETKRAEGGVSHCGDDKEAKRAALVAQLSVCSIEQLARLFARFYHSVYLLYWYKSTKNDAKGAACEPPAQPERVRRCCAHCFTTQFTCFTSTNVQILTLNVCSHPRNQGSFDAVVPAVVAALQHASASVVTSACACSAALVCHSSTMMLQHVNDIVPGFTALFP
jgi:hypothetical protein